MTFQDLRSGCCSTIRTPATRELVKTLPLQRIASTQRIIVDGTSHLHRSFIKIPNTHLSMHLTDLDAMKASVPKLFDCPGSASAPPLRSGWRCGLATACETYNTVGSLPLGLVRRRRHIKTFASSASACALASRLPRKTKT